MSFFCPPMFVNHLLNNIKFFLSWNTRLLSHYLNNLFDHMFFSPFFGVQQTTLMEMKTASLFFLVMIMDFSLIYLQWHNSPLRSSIYLQFYTRRWQSNQVSLNFSLLYSILFIVLLLSFVFFSFNTSLKSILYGVISILLIEQEIHYCSLQRDSYTFAPSF